MLEPIDDVKVHVQTNTVTMKEIKDMLTKESLKTAEMNRHILKMIEDLREDVKKISTDDGHSSKPRVNISPKITANKAFRAKIEEEPTSYIM